ncbi:hypothetical protein LY15_003781 [Prauserella flava]|nr:hypothetical protein [Prauserella flava]MCR3734478.1 hypothetical protein [Prauserella salsuginis]
MPMVLQREQPLERGHARYSRPERSGEPGDSPGSAGLAPGVEADRARRRGRGVFEKVHGARAGRDADTVSTSIGGGVRDRRTVRWVRVVPADSRRPPTRRGPVRPHTRIPVRACARTRITAQGWLLIAVAVGVFSFVVASGFVANALAGLGGSGAGEVPAETAVVSVGAGESLWDIAESTAPEADPAAVVTRIEQLNDLAGGAVRTGTPLVVPVGP